MKNLLLVLLGLILLSPHAYTQQSRVYDRLTMESSILNMTRNYAVYLPPGYDESERYYPVLYLLHGAGDDQTGWIQFGEVQHIADRAIADGTATAMIIVMPDANTGQRGYFNDVNNEWRYEDFFFDELLPFVETKYRIKTEKRYRAIAGLSMGGGGSFFYAMHRPDLFSSACPLSASLRNSTLEAFKQGMENSKTPIKSPNTLQSYYDRHQALRQIELNSLEEMKSVRWYFDCGDDDFLYEGNSLVHIAMKQKEVPHEFRVRDGGHTWGYWRTSLPEVLSFVSESFHQR